MDGTQQTADGMLSLGSTEIWGSAGPRENPGWRLRPGEQTDRALVFRLPEGVAATGLSIVLPMGGAAPVAEWTF
ncbi:hypothetical protein ACQP2E_19395 [Actinoplanes sp. CA-015351]|uniref:hypothetical protein n=1 Tax=Actinoplanes sp. CA-015351 TaxID=3239897 RepID=UPI003D99D69A